MSNSGEVTPEAEAAASDAINDMENRYQLLQESRAREIEEGKTKISPEMRARLQEARLITEQLKYLLNLSENMVQVYKLI